MYKFAVLRPTDNGQYYIKPAGSSYMLCSSRETALQLAKAYQQVPIEYPRTQMTVAVGLCVLILYVGFALL